MLLGVFCKIYQILMAKIFGSVQLPENFAEDILNCQIELDLNKIVPPEIVVSALQLYSKGMEYYESIKSYKFLYFQKKMNGLIRSSKVLDSLAKKEPSPKKQLKIKTPPSLNSPDSNQEDKYRSMRIKHQQDKIRSQIMDKTAYLTGERIKNIICQNQMKMNEVKQSIKGQLNEQEKKLKLKIERRKLLKDSRCLSVGNLTANKSTRDSLFNDGENQKFQQKLQSDFSSVINENQSESEGSIHEMQIQ